MTKRQLIEELARKAHLTKKGAQEAVDVFLSEIARTLAKGEKVVLSGFGTFRVIRMKGKTVKIPGTEKLATVKPHRSARFKPGRALQRKVQK